MRANRHGAIGTRRRNGRVNVSIVVFVSTRPKVATQSERRAGVRESTRRGTRCVSATVDERV
jgi:hypothetical protein